MDAYPSFHLGRCQSPCIKGDTFEERFCTVILLKQDKGVLEHIYGWKKSVIATRFTRGVPGTFQAQFQATEPQTDVGWKMEDVSEGEIR